MNDLIDCFVEDIAAPIRNALVGGPFGSNLVSNDYVEKGIPVIRGQNMGLGRWVSGEFVYVSKEKAKSLSSNIARPGDLIFTQRGTLGQVALIPENEYPEYVISQSQMKLTPNNIKADVLFLYYYFLSSEQQLYIQNNAIQTGVPHTNLTILRNTPISLPPLPEQRAIAEILGSLDDQIENLRSMNATLEETARALFKEWFVDFRYPGHEDVPLVDSELGLIPSGWRVGRLDEAINVIGGGTPRTSIPEYWDGNIPWFSVKDVPNEADVFVIETEKSITQAGVDNSSAKILPELTSIISARGTVGKLALTGVRMAMNQSCYAIRGSGYPEYFTFFNLKTCITELQQQTHGTVFDTITRDTFSNLRIVLPSQDLAESYDQIVRPLLEQIKNNVFESRTLAETRDALLPKLMSGEIRVQDL